MTQGLLNQITAGTVVIGCSSDTGGISIAGALDTSGAQAANFNLTLVNGGSEAIANTSGSTLTLGSHTLTMTAGTGDIGEPDANILTDAANIMANTGGNVYITNSGATTISGASSAGSRNTFQLTASGNLTVASAVTIAGGTINLFTTGTAATAINVMPSSTLTATNGNITIENAGTSSSASISVGNEATMTAGNGNITIENAGTNSSASISVGNAVSMTAGNGNITIENAGTSSSASISVGNEATMTAGNGNITIEDASTSSPASISVGNAVSMTADNGNITIENASTSSSASISVGNGVTMTAGNTSATGVGTINIVIDQIPASPTAGSPPSGNTVTEQENNGLIYFNSGITDNADSSDKNNINANGGTVDFYTNGLPASAISLGKNVIINANQLPTPGLIVLNSLDLTNQTVINDVMHDLSGGYITGSLTDSGSGLSGNFTITATSGVLAYTSLVAQNIPSSVTLTMSGFLVSDPITINITGSSSTKQVIISGAEQFVNSGTSNAQITINSNQTGPALVIGPSGLLSSDSVLNVQVNRDIEMNGTVSGSTVTLQTTANNGNITLGGNVTGTTSTTITAFGSGNITQTAGTVFGGTVYLSSTSGEIGAANARIFVAGTGSASGGSGNQLFIQSLGDAYVSYQGQVYLEQSSVGTAKTLDLLTTCNGSIVLDNGSITGGTLNLTANGSGSIYETTNVSSSSLPTVTSLNLASGTGSIYGPSGTTSNFLFSASSLTANTSGTGSAYLEDTLSSTSLINVGSSSAGVVLHIKTDQAGMYVLPQATIQVAGQASGTAGDLTLTGNNGNGGYDISIGSGATAEVTVRGTITMKANSTGQIVNNGLISDISSWNGGDPVLNGATSLTVSGTGSLSGATTLTAANGAVSLTQNAVDGLVTGSATGL